MKINKDKDYLVTWKDEFSKMEFITHIQCVVIIPTFEKEIPLGEEKTKHLFHERAVIYQLLALLRDIDMGRERFPGGWLKMLQEMDKEAMRNVSIQAIG